MKKFPNSKNMQRKKKPVSDFLTLLIDEMKTKKKQTCFAGIKILNNR